MRSTVILALATCLALACTSDPSPSSALDVGAPTDLGPPDGGSLDAGDALAPPPDLTPADATPDVADAPSLTTASCVEHTRSEAECKDCCDCMGAACEVAVECRNLCPLHDFTANRDFITFSAPSEPGPTGDYQVCTARATEQECKACCDCEGRFQCGARRFCRDACAGPASAWPPLRFSAVGAPALVADTFRFSEGPVWDARSARWLLSDLDADTLYALTLPSSVTVLLTPSRRANGLALDAMGRRLAAEHGSRSVTRTALDGAVQTLAERYEGRRLNSPNDLILRSDGTVYFTDPTYGLGSATSELGFTGLYRLSPEGALTLEARVEGAPNGVALAPGERTLYVAATTAGRILAFDVAPSGATSNQHSLATVDSPDGLTVDAGGNLYVAAMEGGRGAVVVFDHQGHRLGAVPLDHQPTNCALGGADGRTLLVTARQAVYRIAVPIPGF